MGINNGIKLGHTPYIKILVWYLFIVVYTYSVLVFFEIVPYPSFYGISWLSLGVSTLCFYLFRKNRRIATFGLTSVLLIYTILTQFSLGAIYYLLGPEYLSNYTNYTLRFLFSDQYVRAVVAGIIAVMTYTFAMSIGSLKGDNIEKKIKSKSNYYGEARITVYMGYLFLLIVLFYFAFLVFTGRVDFNMNYSSFRSEVITDNSIFSYMLVLYATGISYVISAGSKREIKIGVIIYTLSALILLLTGNKGEVLYALLACIGVSQYRGFKIKPKLIIFLSFLLFILIPFITSVRQKGVISSLGQIGLNFTDAFIEMGFQIRVTVYILEQFASGTREFIYGYSYFNPIVNIIDRLVPVISLKTSAPESFNFKTSLIFAGQGFSQVAENYANFGLVGVVIFFGLLGFTLSKIEARQLTPIELAYFTSIIVIFINVTRNSFAFVPGQIVLMTSFFIILNTFIKKNSPNKTISSC